MSPAAPVGPVEVGARLAAALALDPGVTSVTTGGGSVRACVQVPAARWVEALTAARDVLDCRFFDWLTAVDETDGFAVVAHLWSVAGRYGVLVRTAVPRADPRLATLVPVFAGAAWRERETYEMFGIAFDGHPDLRPLLLPDGFEGHPLRKDFVLASRVAVPWPGAADPSGRPHRTRPPGVPDPTTWGPAAGG